MGVSLITPLGNNFLKDFPAQNAANMNSIDGYAGPCLTSPFLTLTNPVLSAVTTDPVLGTGGFSKAYHYQIFDQIFMWGEFRFGSAGFSVGSGIYILTLPFTVDTTFVTSTNVGNSPVVGNGSTYKQANNTNRLPVLVQLRTTNQIHFSVRMNSGLGVRDVRDSGYMTWAANDGLSWRAQFKRLP